MIANSIRTTGRCPGTRRSRRPFGRGRRGAVLIVIIVCVAIASVIMASLVPLALSRRKAVRTDRWRVQAGHLAESALDRAAARLAADAGYSGETWRLPADAITGDYPAVVTIHVETPAAAPDRRLVRVVADFPDRPQNRARRSKQATIAVRRAPL